jgi:uncharacterized protein (DUF433 family)
MLHSRPLLSNLLMESSIFIPIPKIYSSPSTRDDRLRIQTLYYTAGWTVADILLQNPKLTRKQIDYALQCRPTPQKKRCGRHPLLSTPQRKHLISWATFSSLSRDIPRKELPKWLGWSCGEYAVRTAFKKEGYTRGVRRRKPPISAANQALRLTWAQEHLSWTDEQWDEICWSDESWVQPGYHRRQWCTRKIGPSELFHPDCVQHKWQRRIGWMFWGCISGKYGKGRGLFWEKEWKTITTQSYCEHTCPVIFNYLFNHPGLSFQQDGGPGHKAQATLAYMQTWNLVPIFWLAFSPDLSPIKDIWSRLKDILHEIDPEVHQDSRRLREADLRAWETITDAEIRERIRTMHQRCLDVIAANGMETKW